ncbi:hypothetical protein [Renibacterium salmoninarum]|uniref:hypothetical protein n=1 Tax=Renibacterium salmoninarum TaxID=1646 RepID=UPI00059FAAE5|nr:hypothetical protein [Renibacterium salmoninarum]
MKKTPAARACPEGKEYEVLIPNSMSFAGGRGLAMASLTKVLVNATTPMAKASNTGRQISRRSKAQSPASTITITVNQSGFAAVVIIPNSCVAQGTRMVCSHSSSGLS